MSDPTLTIAASSSPSFRLSPEAVELYLALSPRERSWLYGHLIHSGEQRRMAWLDSESIEAPHDLWVLYQWSEAAQVMDILRLGYFPLAPPMLRDPPPSGSDEARWENEGGTTQR